MQRRYPNARLIVAGEGTERANLENLAATLGLQGVEFIGRVEYEDMPALYDRADIYLNAPNLDNLPSSILESYAAGMPVVTTEAGGIPYILWHEETGLLVGLDDHIGMANAAIRLLEDQVLSEKIIRQALKECDKYTDFSERRSWGRLYQKLTGESLSNEEIAETIADTSVT
ncbi:MAG: glycosyltransferase family 4 protein [Candidatus Doudnabacteria bacterium]|nr:glycosyltransferase family 4 protein [Candidatus Doudnabacteria bacterium]